MSRSAISVPLMSGSTLGNYVLLETLGEGGMGVVHLAEHRLIGKRVAAKILREELTADRGVAARFLNEARATANLRHPHLVEVLDFGYADDGRAYLVMELLEGESLGARLRRGPPLPLHDVVRIGREIAAGVGAAHRAGLVHRDLKPDNVFLHRPDPALDPIAKVLDFGVAKLLDASRYAEVSRTQTAALIGTPMFMSPEQCRGAGAVDHRTDVYALGCLLYAMLCGRPPFQHESPGELIAAHLHERPEPPSVHRPGLPAAFDDLVLALLAKRASDRPQTMLDVASAMAKLPVDEPRPDVERNGAVAANAPQRGTALLPVMGQPASVAGAPTTLGAAAGEATTPSTPSERGTVKRSVRASRGSRVPLVVAAVGAFSAVMIAWLVMRSPSGEPRPNVLARPAPVTFAAPPPPTDPPPTPAATPPAPAPEALPPSPPTRAAAPARHGPAVRKVVVTVRQPPAGLVVTVDGRPATLPLRLPADGAVHQVELRAPGKRRVALELKADRDQVLEPVWRPEVAL